MPPLEKVENRSTWRKLSQSRENNQQQTQPSYGVQAGTPTRTTLVEDKSSHHGAIAATPKMFKWLYERRPAPQLVVLVFSLFIF